MFLLLSIIGLLVLGTSTTSAATGGSGSALYSCGGVPFHLGALNRPRGYERGRSPLARALRAFLRKSANDVGQSSHGWFLLGRRGSVALLASGRRSPYGELIFGLKHARWTWEGSGGCAPRAYHYGLEGSKWFLPARTKLAPSTRRVRLLVQEDNCASGHDARGRVLPPIIRYGTRAITVTYFIRPAGGNQTCQGVPPTPVTLILKQPLGHRALLDGATPASSSRLSRRIDRTLHAARGIRLCDGVRHVVHGSSTGSPSPGGCGPKPRNSRPSGPASKARATSGETRIASRVRISKT